MLDSTMRLSCQADALSLFFSFGVLRESCCNADLDAVLPSVQVLTLASVPRWAGRLPWREEENGCFFFFLYTWLTLTCLHTLSLFSFSFGSFDHLGLHSHHARFFSSKKRKTKEKTLRHNNNNNKKRESSPFSFRYASTRVAFNAGGVVFFLLQIKRKKRLNPSSTSRVSGRLISASNISASFCFACSIGLT